jgi:hypothetical protein
MQAHVSRFLIFPRPLWNIQNHRIDGVLKMQDQTQTPMTIKMSQTKANPLDQIPNRFDLLNNKQNSLLRDFELLFRRQMIRLSYHCLDFRVAGLQSKAQVLRLEE